MRKERLSKYMVSYLLGLSIKILILCQVISFIDYRRQISGKRKCWQKMNCHIDYEVYEQVNWAEAIRYVMYF